MGAKAKLEPVRCDGDGRFVDFAAEKLVLGALMLSPSSYWQIADRLRAEDFADLLHMRIAAALIALIAKGKKPTRSIIISQMGADQGEAARLSPYLAALIGEGADPNAVSDTVDLIASLAHRRRLLKAAQELLEDAQTAPTHEPHEEVTQRAQARIAGVFNETASGYEPIGEVMARVVADAAERYRVGKPAGITVPFMAWNELVGPMLPGQMIAIGGVTKHGKTALAVQVGILAAEAGNRVAMASLEMESAEVAARVLAHYTKFSGERLVSGSATSQQIEAALAASEQRRGLPFFVDERGKQSVAMLMSGFAREKEVRGANLFIVDHLQYVKPDNPRAEEHQRLAQVVDDLKEVAKRLKAPILLITHLRRYNEVDKILKASDIRRPSAAHFYGSSAIEKACDVAILVHRPEMILEQARPNKSAKHYEEWAADLARWKGKAELVLSAKRSGVSFGVREVSYVGEETWFNDPAPIEDTPAELLF